MAEFGRLYTCAKCKEKVPNSHIRYDSEGKELICNSCYLKSHPPKKDLKSVKKGTYEFEKKRVDKKGDYISYVCNNCKYRFKIRIDSERAKRCPYCGKFDLRNLNDEHFTANDLVKESDKYK